MKKQCEICGKLFNAAVHNAKYCTKCQAIAAKITRAKWEQKTGYNEKRNKKRKEQRKALRIEINRQKALEVEKSSIEFEQRLEAARQKYRQELTEKAASGDLWAKKDLALMDKDMYTYWSCVAELEWKEYERFGTRANNYVAGISVYDPDFAEKVMSISQKNHKTMSKKETKCI